MSTIDFLEVQVVLTSHEQVVEVLFFARFLEGEDAMHNDEEDHSEGEHVDLSAVVGAAFLDFWSHVGQSTSVALQLVDRLVGGEAEVSNFHVQVRVNQDVLQFKITVRNALPVHVFQGCQHLDAEKTTDVLAHGAHQLAQVEEEAAGDMLHLHVDKVLDEAARGLLHKALVAVALLADDVRVAQVA